jgi:predicted RNase H-like HicB family nuclease
LPGRKASGSVQRRAKPLHQRCCIPAKYFDAGGCDPLRDSLSAKLPVIKFDLIADRPAEQSDFSDSREAGEIARCSAYQRLPDMTSNHAIAYPVTLTAAEGTVLITCDDLPEFYSIGCDEQEALAEAPDRLAIALRMYRQDGRRFPKPSEGQPGQTLVFVRSLTR